MTREQQLNLIRAGLQLCEVAEWFADTAVNQPARSMEAMKRRAAFLNARDEARRHRPDDRFDAELDQLDRLAKGEKP